jgi:hypothetical protein
MRRESSASLPLNACANPSASSRILRIAPQDFRARLAGQLEDQPQPFDLSLALGQMRIQ